MLLTYEQACAIVKGNQAFYQIEKDIQGQKVYIFNYFLAEHKDFVKPLADYPWDAYEMRGLTFVKEIDGSMRRVLMLPKFFNLDQTIETLYETVKDKEIDTVQTKEDGSMIGFVKFANGQVMARTKLDFDNLQCRLSIALYNDDPVLRQLIDAHLENNESPIFEITSPLNRIVVNYPNTRLKFLHARNNETGEFVAPRRGDRWAGVWHMYAAVKYDTFHTLDSVIETLENHPWNKNFEGFVVKFKDGQLVKVKSKWYMDMHRLVTEDLTKEDIICQCALDETLDDKLSLLDADDARRIHVERVASALRFGINNKLRKIKFMLQMAMSSILSGVRTKKDIALSVFAKDKNPDLEQRIMMRLLPEDPSKVYVTEEQIRERLVEYYKQETYRLERARAVLKEWGYDPIAAVTCPGMASKEVK